MASNTEALQSLSDERRAVAGQQFGGGRPIGGNPVPDANTTIENSAANSGDAPASGDRIPNAADVPTVDAESSTARRGTSTKAAPAKS